MAQHEERSLDEFRATGLMVFANQFLHIFGWTLVVETCDTSGAQRLFPARTLARGFPDRTVVEAYQKVSAWMVKEAPALQKESLE